MEAEVFKRRHSITASCSRLMNDSDEESEEEEPKPKRKLFQAKVQKLLAVRWFTQKRGIRLRHLRKSACCTDVLPTQEEEALLGKVLCNRHLMHKTMEMLQSFQREISGVDGFFDELGVEPSWVPGRLEDSMFDDKKESLMKLAVKAIHEAKWVSLRICYNDYMKQQEQELKVLKQNYEKLTNQFAEVRQDYLQEVATLRDQVRIRGDVDTTGWIDEAGGDVVYFFDPAKALTPKEAQFVLHAVKEKLLMILEHNPRIGGAVDLGQLEKLKDLKENKELELLKATLLARSRELLEAQRTLRKLQEEQLEAEQATPATPAAPGRSKHRFDRMMLELEDKVSQLRHDAANLKRQVHVESKERHHAEETLKELQAEHHELRQHAEDLEQQHSLGQSEVRALREELDWAHARNMDLQDSEKALKAKMESFQKSHEELIQVLQRKLQWENPEGASIADSGTSDLLQDGALASSQLDTGGLGKRQRTSDALLEEAHQQVIDALQQKDLSASAAEDLRKENAQLRRELVRQSRGVLLMDAEASSQKATDLAAFLGSLQNQLGASKTSRPGKGFSLSFPELEKRLAEATEKAGTSLKAVLQALRKPRHAGAKADLQLLQQESLRSQQEKQQLERELFEVRLQHLSQGLGTLNPRKADDEKLHSLVSCSLKFLQSMSQTMQQLANENTTLRESLLTFSSSLSQASSMVSARGHPELESLLSSITANAECAVPAVFRRLFNDSRKLDPRLEQEARERREGLMKSLIYHLSEEQHDANSRPVDHRISLRQGVEGAEEVPTSARPRLLRQRSSMENLEEAPASARPRLVQRQRSSKEETEDLPATRPTRILAKQRSVEEPIIFSAPVSAQARSFLDEDHEDAWLNASRGSWSRQCSGASEVSNSSSRMSSKRQGFLGITSLEFKATPIDSMKATKLRIPRHKPEGLMLPQVPIQAAHSPASSELQVSGGDSGDAQGESDLESSSDDQPEERTAGLPQVAVRAPQESHHFLQSQMELQDRRISISDLKPLESWPSRMKNALTGRRLSHLVRRPEPVAPVARARRSSVS